MKNIKSKLLSVATILVVVGLAWDFYITVQTWNLCVTRWENFLLYKYPMFFTFLPAFIILVIISSIKNK